MGLFSRKRTAVEPTPPMPPDLKEAWRQYLSVDDQARRGILQRMSVWEESLTPPQQAGLRRAVFRHSVLIRAVDVVKFAAVETGREFDPEGVGAGFLDQVDAYAKVAGKRNGPHMVDAQPIERTEAVLDFVEENLKAALLSEPRPLSDEARAELVGRVQATIQQFFDRLRSELREQGIEV